MRENQSVMQSLRVRTSINRDLHNIGKENMIKQFSMAFENQVHIIVSLQELWNNFLI